jgi:hypothetical protein
VKSLTKHNLNALTLALLLTAGMARAATANATNTPAIPSDQIGAKAGADYHGDGLTVTPTEHGARLRCAFQRLEGEATPEGLWLTSTVNGSATDRFRVVAAEVTRQNPDCGVRNAECGTDQSFLAWAAMDQRTLSSTGNVSVDGQAVRFTRPGLIEDYSVNMNGVRQDFVVLARPDGAGQLRVELDVAGASVESRPDGARLVLEKSGLTEFEDENVNHSNPGNFLKYPFPCGILRP